MENDYKYESRKQYLRYFRVWFIVAGILAVICVGVLIADYVESRRARTNMNAPTERVYDYADVLTDEQEENLRKLIAQSEQKYKIDIVLVTINQPMEGEQAKVDYDYSSTNWVENMRNTADDFWDKNKYGFNKDFEGDGALLLSNWYERQAGEHLATSGVVEYEFSRDDIDYLLDRVGLYIEKDPYKAYQVYVEALCAEISGAEYDDGGFTKVTTALGLPTMVALIYLLVHIYRKKDKDTTTATTYVAGGKPVMNEKSDRFLRKHVTKRRIESNSSGGGGGSRSSRSSGGGGHHRSSSGASHGGGSRRR